MEDLNVLEIVKIDVEAPYFNLKYYDPIKDIDGEIGLSDLNGKWVVLFFYPADFTFVCPTELKDMADLKSRFDELGVEVLTCSTDTIFSHRAWVKHEKLIQGFPYKMLSDHNLEISSVYDVLDEKTGFAGRGTFIIDQKGIVRYIEITSGALGRNSEELIRKIEALQYMSKNPTQACPAKWISGAKTLTPSIKISGEVYEALN